MDRAQDSVLEDLSQIELVSKIKPLLVRMEMKSILISGHTVHSDSAETRTDKKTPLITPIYLLKLRLFGPN